jgi:hypothetical protein
VPGSACERCPVYAGAGYAVTAPLRRTLREPPPAPASPPRQTRGWGSRWFTPLCKPLVLQPQRGGERARRLGRVALGPETRALLEAATESEPQDRLRERMEQVLRASGRFVQS